MSLFKFFNHFNLRAKFSLVMVALVILIVGGILGFVYYQEKGIILQKVEQRALDIATVLAFNSVQAVLLDDYLVLQNLVDGISNRPGVIEAMVLNTQGLVLVHKHTGERGKSYHDPRSEQAIQSEISLALPHSYNGERILDVSVPVIVSSEKRATARIFFSLEEAYAAVRKTAYNILFLGLLGVVVSILLASFLSQIVTSPIRELLEAVKRIGQGQRDVRAEIQYHDETGELALAFNKMVKDIAALEENMRRSERLAALGMAAASLAHKIKTPLTSIRTFTEMLSGRHTDAEFREAFQYHVLLEVNHLDQIINDLSNFSRERKLSVRETDVNNIISHTVSILKKGIQTPDIQIITHLESLPLILADEQQLTEAFLIIGENAIEALSGKGLLQIQTKLTKSDGQLLRTDLENKIRITFTDTGKGIAPEDLNKIFEPFFSTKPKGLGLGLVICAKIIEQHQGAIKVHSEVGKGTTVEVILPAGEW